MKITRDNIEAFLLDYHEGNLDPALTAELMAFLVDHPEYEGLLQSNEHPDLREDETGFPDKNLLKKDFIDIALITPDNFEEFCIAASEKILSSEDMKRLDAYMGKNPELRSIFRLYEKLKLQPDPAIRFYERNRLKKAIAVNPARRYLYLGLAVAASLTIFLMLALNIKPRPSHSITGEKMVPVGNVNKMISDSIHVNRENKTVIHAETIPPSAQKPLHHVAPAFISENIPREPGITEQISPIQVIGLENTIHADITRFPVRQYKSSPVTRPLTDERSTEASESLLAALISKVDFWKTAETAISGFNYLTESQLSIGKTTDEKGRLNGLLVHTENFSISATK